jgi:hypothetical protein
MKNFRPVFLGSMVLAFITFATGYFGGRSLTGALFLAGFWAAVVVFALFSFKKRAVWLLLGAPLALFWPWVFAALRLWSLREGGQ